MKLYKHLNVDNESVITQKLCDFVVNNTSVMADKIFWTDIHPFGDLLSAVPELKELLNNMGLIPRHISVVYVEYNTDINIHVDDAPSIRILWPIMNCEGSETRFYTVADDYIEIRHLSNGAPYHAITDPSKCTQISALKLSSPALIDPGVPHGVYIAPGSPGPRLTLTIGFKNPPVL